ILSVLAMFPTPNRAVLLRGRLETIPFSNRCLFLYAGSLLVENIDEIEFLTISIGAFGSRGHRLAAVRDHSATRGLVRPTSFLALVGNGIGIDLLYGDDVIRCALSSNREGCAIVLRRVGGVYHRPISTLSCVCYLHSTTRCFPNRGQAFQREWCRCVLRFLDIELPCAKRIVSAKSADGGDCQSDKRPGENCLHLSGSLEFRLKMAV